MKKSIITFCFCLFILSGCQSEDYNNDILLQEEDLVGDNYNYEDIIIGVWQASPAVGSGYADKYHFFEDMTFRFDYSQFNGEKRDISLYGTWELENNWLYITVKSKKTKVGGDFVKSIGSISSNYMLKNSEIVVEDLERELKIIYPLEEVIESVDSPLYMTIGNVEYWRLTPNPDMYQE